MGRSVIGSDALGSVLGAAPVGDPERIISIVRAMIRIGLSPVLNKPGTKHPICILSAAAAKKADDAARAEYIAQYPDRPANRITHDCGLKHVLDDPAKVTVIVKRAQARYGDDLNLGLHLGRSRLLVVDVDTEAEREAFLASWSQATGFHANQSITVESPGFQDPETGEWLHKNGGHWYFTVPEGFDFPTGKVFKGPGSWAAMWGESQVLVPPSVRPEGPYRLTGTPTPAPAWLLDQVGKARELVASGNETSSFSLTPEHVGNPIEQWSAQVGWDTLLTADGWAHSGTNTDCGCPNYRAPGGHASPKSATAHQDGCKIYDTSTGWAPLKIWTDHPPAGLPPEGAVTKFDYLARTRYAGDISATKVATGIPDWAPTGGVVLDPKAPVGTATALPTGLRDLEILRADNITMRTTRWSWLDMINHAKWIPQGELTLMGGRESMGKSSVCYWIAAQITRGTLPGDNEGRPRSVIVSATEDAWEQTVVPRLAAAGADLHRVLRVDVRRADALMEGLSLPADVPAVAQLCRAEDVGLILLDPLLGSIGGRLDTHKDSDVRQALEPLSRLAHDAQVTVIGLIHQNKSSSGDLLTKLMGSRAFSAVARSVLVCAEETSPVQVSPQDGPSFLFGQLKSNLGPKAQVTRRYRIRERQVAVDPDFGDPVMGSYVEWIGSIEAGIEEVLEADQKDSRRAETPQGEAGAWVLAQLAENGPSSRKELQDRAAQAGYARNTLDRAIGRLEDSLPPAIQKRMEGRVAILSLPAPEPSPVLE